MTFTDRVRAAFLTSMADLLLGAAAILIVLIVLAKPPTEVRVQRVVDLVLNCRLAEDGLWLVAASRSDDWRTIANWFETEARSALLLRTGLLIERSQMGCFREFASLSSSHNSRLTQRNGDGASVAPILLPYDPATGAMQAGPPRAGTDERSRRREP